MLYKIWLILKFYEFSSTSVFQTISEIGQMPLKPHLCFFFMKNFLMNGVDNSVSVPIVMGVFIVGVCLFLSKSSSKTRMIVN